MVVAIIDFITHTPLPQERSRYSLEPEGLISWYARATGDGSGGVVQMLIQSKRTHEFIYILDDIGTSVGLTAVGKLLLGYFMLQPTGVARLFTYRARDFPVTGFGDQYLIEDMRPPRSLLGSLAAEAGEDTSLMLAWFAVNVNGQSYDLGGTGRYYRKDALSRPGFISKLMERR